MKSFALVLLLGLAAPLAAAGAISTQEFNGEIRKQVSLKYALFLPEGYDQPANQNTTYPAILFLHGAGERGDDLGKITNLGPLAYARDHARGFPFIILAPQCPLGKQWQTEVLIAFLDEAQKRYRINPAAVYLTGYSMGGAGTWATAMEHPDRFAAIAPLCGRVIPLLSGNLAQTPVWVFHGEKDEVVPLSQSREMVDILKSRNNPQVKFSVLAGQGHEIWPEVYAGSALYSWFMEHRNPRARSAVPKPNQQPAEASSRDR